MGGRTAALAAVLALAAALRLHQVDLAAPLGNEYLYFYLSLHPTGLGEFLRGIQGNPLHLALDQLIYYVVAKFGDSPGWLRLPDVLWGCLGVLGVWRFAEVAGIRRAAAPAALLLAVSLLHVEWSRRTELYALISALSVWHTIAFLELNGRGMTRLYAVLSVLLLYASPYAAPLALLQGLSLIGQSGARSRFAAFARAWVIAAAGFAPWLFFTGAYIWRTRLLGADYIAHHPEAHFPFPLFLARMPLYLAQGSELSPELCRWGPLLSGALAILYLGFSLVSFARKTTSETAPALRFCRIAVPGGILLTVLLDAAFGNYLAARQLLWVLPFYLVCVADGALFLFDRCSRNLTRRWKTASAAALLAVWLACAVSLTGPELARQADSGVSLERLLLFVKAHARDGDTLVFRSAELAHNILFHLDRGVFRGLPRFRELPPDLTAAIGERRSSVAIQESGTPPPGAWLFEGSTDDLHVTPPLRSAAGTSLGARGQQ